MTMNNEEKRYSSRPSLSEYSFCILFAFQFLLILIGGYINIKLGVATLATSAFFTVIALIEHSNREFSYSRMRNGMLLLFLLWGVFCIIELGNPNNVQEAWNIGIVHYFIIPIICALLVPLTIRDLKGIEWLLVIWAIFILLATIKGYWQKNHGFNEKELYFLYTLGGASTHIIWSGIRYFSYFTDAANYGVHSAMAASTFGIAIFYVRKSWMKALFAITLLCGIYGLAISGTRAAVAVPLGAILLFIIISKNIKAIISGCIIFSTIFIFFHFTEIGNGNEYIRKMRSAFNPTTDASYLVRVENRKKMKLLMIERPIGYGIGLSKGERFSPKELMPYPPDSWLVSVWVETGIIGLLLYLTIHCILFAWCSWILMFKVRNKRLRGLLSAWLCMNAGFFISAYVNDVMQYPNSIVIYTGFALCLAGPYIDKVIYREEKTKQEKPKKEQEESEW